MRRMKDGRGGWRRRMGEEGRQEEKETCAGGWKSGWRSRMKKRRGRNRIEEEDKGGG
jgi:hypothetical protein